MRIQAVGQSTFIVTTVDGSVIVIDPWFGEHPLARRAVPLPAGLVRLPRCDLVLASHNHVDHVDRPSLRAAATFGAAVAGPPAVARRARLARVRRVHRLRRGEQVELGGVTVEAVFATHPLCVRPIGFLLTDADGTTLYHSGDTRYDPRIVDDVGGRRVDVACVQIAAATYPWIGHDGMNVSDAARLASEIEARAVVPMHFHVRGKTQDPARLTDALGDHRVRVLRPGESAEVG